MVPGQSLQALGELNSLGSLMRGKVCHFHCECMFEFPLLNENETAQKSSEVGHGF